MKKQKELEYGVMCISLDTEFFWGVHDTSTIEKYKDNIYTGKHTVIPALLNAFTEYNISATWAVVGAIMAKDINQLNEFVPIPEDRPKYADPIRSPYHLLDTLGTDLATDDLFFGQDVIQLIKNTKHQEIGTHTFSHYYCCENGQTAKEFSADINSAIKLASSLGIKLTSIVFPKNEMSDDHISVCADMGLKSFRGEERNWIYSLKAEPICKGLRFLDSYFNLSGDNTHTPFIQNGSLNITGSSFLRPYCKKLAFLEHFKIERIKKQMLAAAKKKEVFHIWWHPHNFGTNLENNLNNLREILEYYNILHKEYGFQSLNMSEITELLIS